MLALLVPQTSVAQLDEVVVTAERRTQSLQETPIAATVLSADAIQDKGITNLFDLQSVSPSLAVNQVGRSAFVNIRGVGISRSSPTGTPGVATYLDGQFIAHEFFIGGSAYYDLASIEILRGPQGTLTGQNSTGGALYLRTPEPTFDSFYGYVDQTVADYDTFRTTAAANIPFSDKVAMRVAGSYNTYDSYSDCRGCPTQPGAGDSLAWRANLQIEPNDSMQFNLRAENIDVNTDNYPVKRRDDAQSSDPFVLNQDARTYLDQDILMLSAEAAFDLGDSVRLRFQVSYHDFEVDDQDDGDRTATELPDPDGSGRVSKATTTYEDVTMAEINLVSTGDGPLNWVVGAFYFTEDSTLELLRDETNTTDFFVTDSRIAFDPLTNTSQSLFGQVDYRFSSSFELSAGLRYSEDEQDLLVTQIGPFTDVPLFVDDDETTGRLALKYFNSEESMFYASISKGYKAGGLNPLPFLPAYGPETNTSLEAGWKTTLADGRLRLNTALHYSDYDGIQLPALINGFPATENSSAVDVYGIEIEAIGASDNLEYDFGISYLSSELAEDAVLTNPRTGMNDTVSSGTTMPWAPEWSVNGGIQYNFEIGSTLVRPRLQVSYLDQMFVSPFHFPETTTDDRTLVDLRLAIVPNDNWWFEVFATNLFDEEYVTTQRENSSSTDGGYFYGAPRQIGARARFSF